MIVRQRRDMLELLDDRYGNRSTLVTSQMPVDKWHALIGDPTLGDAILDCLLHNAYRTEPKSESMRRRALERRASGQALYRFVAGTVRVLRQASAP